ncbi:DoxX family protein [Streptomyces durbertensis]|uniref:DoxX family protein n=1 Tax=Streptomyces durbertensis TaxID=2448886 RepID=A0ABR6E9J8_9ACTN|nr:DoxX family protein [Streptomyces durbertensis]MBB1242019.1 DoxX family protein [Streptomyces durbertensis]
MRLQQTPALRQARRAGHLLDSHREHVLGLFRIVVGLLFACHGAATLFGVLGGGHGPSPAVGQWPGWWAAMIQLVGGAMVLTGIGARSAAFLCSGSMAYAYFVHHQPDALFPLQNGGVTSALYCWAFFLIVALGPGRWTLPALFGAAASGGRRPVAT